MNYRREFSNFTFSGMLWHAHKVHRAHVLPGLTTGLIGLLTGLTQLMCSQGMHIGLPGLLTGLTGLLTGLTQLMCSQGHAHRAHRAPHRTHRATNRKKR